MRTHQPTIHGKGERETWFPIPVSAFPPSLNQISDKTAAASVEEEEGGMFAIRFLIRGHGGSYASAGFCFSIWIPSVTSEIFRRH